MVVVVNKMFKSGLHLTHSLITGIAAIPSPANTEAVTLKSFSFINLNKTYLIINLKKQRGTKGAGQEVESGKAVPNAQANGLGARDLGSFANVGEVAVAVIQRSLTPCKSCTLAYLFLLPHPFLSPQNDLRFASTSAATSSETEPWKIAHLMFRIKWFVTAQNSRPIHYLEL